MLSLVGFNIAVNAPTIGRDVASILNTTTKPAQPGAVKSQSKDHTLSFKIGESEGSMTPPHASIGSLVKALRLSTEKIVSISVTGNTSPEYGNNAQNCIQILLIGI